MSEPGGPAREPTDQPTKPAEPYVAPQKKSALGVRVSLKEFMCDHYL